jgi:hypothetical protein
MMKLLFLVLLEVVVAIAIAGGILAAVVPVLVEHHTMNPGDLRGSVLIVGVMVMAVGAMLFRPGSALRRSKGKEL